MNGFELFKLRKAGLSNGQILAVLDYQERHHRSLSLRDMAVVSKVKNPSDFMGRYKDLNSKILREEFNRFPCLSILDKDYPFELRNIYNPPVLLFYQGDINLLNRPKLAVVGSRKASDYGTRTVKKIIGELKQQFVIVSGLARGVDTAAHMAVLREGGQSIAVIGTGLDVFYPRENKELQAYMGQHHLVLSEYESGQAPLKFHFPDRNRIIAGLSWGVLVAEAKMRSGSLITCERALEEGREVFAVPGNILDKQSEGCHRLIQEGAKCVYSAQDILIEYPY